MTYIVTKIIKGNPYLYEVRSEREGDRVRQVFVRYLGREGSEKAERRAAEVRASEEYSPPVREAVAPSEVETETLVTPPTGEAIAKELGIKYDGIQEGIGMQFTDPQTGSTTYGNTLEEVEARINDMREKFAEAEIKPVEIPAPEPEIISTPAEAKDYIIKKEPEPFLPTGFKYMVYQSDGTPMYISGETQEEVEGKLREGHKVASVKVEVEAEVAPVADLPTFEGSMFTAPTEIVEPEVTPTP